MRERSLIVIGAGLAGLAAGVYGRRNGYRTIVFEHADGPGGVAAWWRRGDYLIDGGIHFLMGHRPGSAIHDLYRQLGTAAPGTVIEMTDYGRWLDEASGSGVTLGADLDLVARELERLSPADAQAVRGFVDGARAFAAAGAAGMDMGAPPELAGRLDGATALWRMRRVLLYFAGSHGRSAGEFAATLKDPTLARVFESLFLPDAPMWFLYMLFGLLAGGQLGLLARGCEGFVLPIETLYRQLGGRVEYGRTVDRILIEEDRVIGVRTDDGRVHRADAVIAAGDAHRTLLAMLDPGLVDEAAAERLRNWRLIPPWVIVSLGVGRTFPGEPHLTTYRLAEPLAVGRAPVTELCVRVFNYSPHFAPEGKTVIQPSFESDWDHWRGLHERDPLAYRQEKERVASEVIRRLEAHHPGLSSQIEVVDVATPWTTYRYTLNTRGAYMGWLPTAGQLRTALPRTLPGLSGLVMAGQWVVPGGGVPTCLQSGRDAVRILCRRDGVRFRAAEG